MDFRQSSNFDAQTNAQVFGADDGNIGCYIIRRRLAREEATAANPGSQRTQGQVSRFPHFHEKFASNPGSNPGSGLNTV